MSTAKKRERRETNLGDFEKVLERSEAQRLVGIDSQDDESFKAAKLSISPSGIPPMSSQEAAPEKKASRKSSGKSRRSGTRASSGTGDNPLGAISDALIKREAAATHRLCLYLDGDVYEQIERYRSSLIKRTKSKLSTTRIINEALRYLFCQDMADMDADADIDPETEEGPEQDA